MRSRVFGCILLLLLLFPTVVAVVDVIAGDQLKNKQNTNRTRAIRTVGRGAAQQAKPVAIMKF